jgi:integrase
MGYREVKDQSGVEKGYVKFLFDVRFKDERYRRVETCRRSAVAAIFRDWEDSILSGTSELQQYKFFEIYDTYLKYAENCYSKRSYAYTLNILKYFKSCYDSEILLSDFKRSDVLDYISWRKGQRKQRGGQPLSFKSINREIAELSRFFTYCIERELFDKVNPCFRQKLRTDNQREVFLTPEQLQELMNTARAEGDSIFSAVLIALSSGFRRGEVFNLEWKDIDFKHSRIFLRASTTKNKKSRIVAVPDFLVEHLQERREKAFDKQGRVFQEWKSEEWLRNAFERVRNKLSFNPLPNGTNLHFHDLRHVYAQSLRDMGIALQDIQAFLGHSSVSVTEMFYAQAGGKDAKVKVERLAEIIPFRKTS